MRALFEFAGFSLVIVAVLYFIKLIFAKKKNGK